VSNTTGDMFKNYSQYIGVIVGTGPSVNETQLNHIRLARQEDKCRIITINNSYQVIDPDIHFACNFQWWDYYFKTDPRLKELRDGGTDMWTWNKDTANKYKINHVPGRWKDSLSTDKKWIHFGHGSGFEGLGVCYHYDFHTIVLVGYDLKFPKGYNGKKKVVGEGKRHYFGEYPKTLQHWTQSPNSVDKNGKLIGLIQLYEKIDCKKLDVNIINCTPGSALTCFPNKRLEEAI